VASDMCLGSLGSDTGGSVRQPAGFCGVVGLKPTYGAVSRHGLIALASSLDQIGPLAKTVEDAKIIFDVIKGHDQMDSTTVVDYNAKRKVKNEKRIGIPWNFLETGMDEDMKANFELSVKKLEGLGYKIEEVKLPHLVYSLPVYYIIMPAEASANLSRYDGVRYGFHKADRDLLGDYMKTRKDGFGAEVRRRILLGTYVLSAGYYDAYYRRAIEVRRVIENDFNSCFNEVTGIVMPITPGPAFKIGEKGSDRLKMYLEDIFTVSANIAGLPALSVPAGVVKRRGVELPVGLQVVGPHFGEEIIFKIGSDFESAR